MMTKNDPIYLASHSLRRRELLATLGLDCKCVHVNIDESALPREAALSYVKRLAVAKAAAGWQEVQSSALPSYALLAADTIAVYQRKLYGKPLDADDAYRTLRVLSGQTHQVVTAVAVRRNDTVKVQTSVTGVTFRDVADDEIQRYIDGGEPFDKAGAYAIQGKAAVFVKRIDGSFSGVVGLPLFETAALLAEFNYVFP